MEFPHSPDEAIDPRWTNYLHAQSVVAGEAKATTGNPAALGDLMREIIEPWQQGRRGTRETLAALRDLADREL